jgi:tRNA threonylcarbamoyladenosine biosynthesis protein TsaE
MTKFEAKQLDEAHMLALADKLAKLLMPAVIYLEGNLGAGKTTFSRGLIQGLGHHGAVKSPTFTLVEPYENLKTAVYHFDLYRLSEPEELEYMGARDYFSGDHICLVEWPSKGLGHVPEADLLITLERCDAASRNIAIEAKTALGESIVAKLIKLAAKR